MKGLPLRLVAPHPVHCRSALLTPHRRLFLLARQLLSSVSLHLPLSSVLWTSSYAGETERSARVRPRSASLRRKCDVQGNAQSPDVYALPPPLPAGGGPEMSGSSGAPNVSRARQGLYSARQGVYSETPNTYSGVAQSMYDAIRNINPPPPTGPGGYSSPPYSIHEGPEYAYAQASGSSQIPPTNLQPAKEDLIDDDWVRPPSMEDLIVAPTRFICAVVANYKSSLPPYAGFDWLDLEIGQHVDIVVEAGPPSAHPEVKPVDDGEDMLLIARRYRQDIRGYLVEVGWVWASFIFPVQDEGQ